MAESWKIQSQWGEKEIEVVNGLLQDLNESADLLVCSAFKDNYVPTFSSMIGALYWDYGISVAELAQSPLINLRDLGVWISHAVPDFPFHHIACVEIKAHMGTDVGMDAMRGLYETLFFALKHCKLRGIDVASVAMPVLGTGNQFIPLKTSLIPMISECVSALKTIPELKRILIFNPDARACACISEMLADGGLSYGERSAFISYSHRDAAVANMLANGLEANGIKPWIDHRMIRNPDYAEEIVKGISEAEAFLILVSSASMQSPDVLREVRNAGMFADRRGLLIRPVLLERIAYPPKFSYYLAGLDYTDLTEPPLEPKALSFCARMPDVLQNRSSER